MGERKAAFHDAARRRTVGDKHELATLPGFWIKPRKHSSQGAAEIQAISMANADLPDDLIEKIGEIVEERGAENIDGVNFIKLLGPADRMRAIKATSGSAVENVHVRRLKLLHGIGEHNFYEDGPSTQVDDELVGELLEYREQAAEVVEIIDAFNRPLADAPDAKSTTLPDGSSTASTSTLEPSTPMGPDPPKS